MLIIKSLKEIAVFICVALLVNACATAPKGRTVSEEVFSILEDQRQQAAAVPDFVTQAIASADDEKAPASILNRRFDVSVKDIPAKAFFLSLISDVGVNVVAHPKVDGTISLELKNVTVDEVLEVVRDVYGYEYQFSNNIYTVYASELRTEIYPVNYIDVKRVGVSDTSVSMGEIGSSSGESADSSQGGGGSGAADLLSMAGVEGAPQTGGVSISPGSRIQTLNNTDFWQMLKLTVSSIVDVSQEGRVVVINPQSGLIVVTAMPAELNSVRKFIDSAELSVQRQVILETQILEVRLSKGFEAGVDWGAIQGQLSYAKDLSRTTDSSRVPRALNQGLENFSSVFNVVDVRELLSLLDTQGDVQVLSSPRVSTVNNQKALIRVGTDEFFVTGIKNSTTQGGGATTSGPEVQLSSFFSGISLDVTPQISENGDVILHVHPIVSDVRDQLKELTIGGSNFSLPLAVRDIRESDSIVRAKSGHVIVLGGLMQKSSNNVSSRQPWLSKIPIINLLFKHKKSVSAKTELVILMRPVVVAGDTWDRQLERLKSQSDVMAKEYRSR